MNEYVLWYCRYDPDNYFGHRKVSLKATTREEAEKEARALLDRSFTKGPWEMQIFEVSWYSGAQLHPTR